MTIVVVVVGGGTVRPAYRIVTAVVQGQAVGSAVLLLLLSIVMDIYDASELLRNNSAGSVQ